MNKRPISSFVNHLDVVQVVALSYHQNEVILQLR